MQINDRVVLVKTRMNRIRLIDLLKKKQASY